MQTNFKAKAVIPTEERRTIQFFVHRHRMHALLRSQHTLGMLPLVQNIRNHNPTVYSSTGRCAFRHVHILQMLSFRLRHVGPVKRLR